MQLEVVTVNKSAESLFQVPAAVYAITRSDIERSGAENITDLLVRVPGLSVKQVTRQRIAVSIRNDSQLYLSTILVLIDGQPVYAPRFNAPFWEALNVPLDEIERIEIIRGSGGISWGANSSTGVINIITRKAGKTRQGQAEIAAGTQSRGVAKLGVQHGLGNSGLRLFLQYEQDDGFENDNPIPEDSRKQQALLRWDGEFGEWESLISLRALKNCREERGIFTGDVDEGEAEDYNAYAQIRRSFDSNQSAEIRIAWNKQDFSIATLNNPSEESSSESEIFDLTALYELNTSWGITHFTTDYRYYDMQSDDDPSGFVYSDPSQDDAKLYAFSVNHQYPFLEHWRADIGFRIEDYSFLEDDWLFAPGLRLSYNPKEDLFLWGSITKTHQFPNYLQNASVLVLGTVNNPFPAIVMQKGTKALDAEEVLDIQFGLRWLPTPNTWIDVALYWIDQDNQIYIDPNSTVAIPGVPLGEVTTFYNNFIETEIRGAELMWHYKLHEELSTELNVSYLKKDSKAPDRPPLTSPTYAPRYKVNWLVDWNITGRLCFSSVLTWEESYTSENTAGLFADPSTYSRIDDVWRWDFNLTHQATKRMTLYLSAKNIFNNHINWNYLIGSNPAQKVDPSVTLGMKILLF